MSGLQTLSWQTSTYYPATNDGRAAWWQNIIDNGQTPLTALGFATADITAIQNDAQWAVFAYSTVRQAFDEFLKSVTRYADEILHGTPDGAIPANPTVPAFPSVPFNPVPADVEARHELWVQQAKNRPNYNQTLGAVLGIGTLQVPFDPATYQAHLYGLRAVNAHMVSGKFRKATGNVDSINLYGRKSGASA